jgi:hypothetical protein
MGEHLKASGKTSEFDGLMLDLFNTLKCKPESPNFLSSPHQSTAQFCTFMHVL